MVNRTFLQQKASTLTGAILEIHITAAITSLQTIKTHVAQSMDNSYKGSIHTTPDMDALVWRIADVAQELELQIHKPNRKDQAKRIPDLYSAGRAKIELSSLATFNKRIEDSLKGRVVMLEQDELPPVAFAETTFDEGSHV